MVTELKLQVAAKKILRAMNVRGATLDIFLLPHEEIKALKAKFIKKKTEPNVLAFPAVVGFPHPEKKKIYLGEVYLNSDILARQPERTAPLLVHGTLHLLGFDHIKKADAQKMEALEKQILPRILAGEKK